MRPNQRQILSAADIRRAIVLLTVLSVVISVALSAFFVLVINAFDLSGVTTVRKVFNDTLIVSAVLPALICPLVVHRLAITVRDLNLARAELDTLARTDPLTGLLNRRGFDEASANLAQDGAGNRKTIAIALCDIDHFKRVNDVHGHDCGDRALKHVASILQDAVGSDRRLVTGRQGGEEFVLAAAGLTIRELAAVAERIRSACATRPLREDGYEVALTISIGTAIAIQGEESVRELVLRADAALYRAKQNGRNRIEVALPVLADAA